MPDTVHKMGVDVGGTFTHAVIVATPGPHLITSARVPTTHRHESGVAEGIIQAARRALEQSSVAPQAIRLIAHSTTQATNALLEGDVATVGILAAGSGVLGQKVKSDTAIGPVPLGKNMAVNTVHHFLAMDDPADDAIRTALASLREQGAGAVVAAQAYAVDRPDVEERIVALAVDMGLPATATHHISSLYGLKARLRTAVINAAILPIMTATANHTERALRESGLDAPLMVVRSDGGMMSLEEMHRRPLLTLLSGPAAGVAAAVKFSRLSQAVFLEVGGTSTDMSVILGGQARLKTATVGGHRLHLKTVDVTTEGLAGGSLFLLENNRPVDVGPRSAHIAGLGYAAFSPQTPPLTFTPHADERHTGKTYLAVKDDTGRALTLTPTCVANALGRIGEGTPATGDRDAIATVTETAASALGTSPDDLLHTLDKLVTDKASAMVQTLLKEQQLGGKTLVVAGGGGGAAAFTSAVAEALGMEHQLVPHAEVISAIGAALAAVKETVERNNAKPTEADLLAIRQEALSGALRMGARADTVTVQVSVDPARNLIRAEAIGSTDATMDTTPMTAEAALAHVRPLLPFHPQTFQETFRNGSFVVGLAAREDKRLLGLSTKHQRLAVVVERTGVLRVAVDNPHPHPTQVGALKVTLSHLLSDRSNYGDAGQELPPSFVVAGHKLVDLSAVGDLNAAVALATLEVEELPPDTPCLIVLGKPVL